MVNCASESLNAVYIICYFVRSECALSLSLTRCAYSDKLLFISAVFAIIMREYSGYSNNSKILGNCDNDKALARRQQ